MPKPYEMVSGPLTVYTAPESTVAPALNVGPPAPLGIAGDEWWTHYFGGWVVP